MTKVAWVLIAFNSDYVLEPCLRSVMPYGCVYAAEGPVSFWHKRGYATSTDKTNAILEYYRIPTVHGQWTEKTDESNAALSQVPDDVDFVWVLDSDEIWRAQDIEAILRILATGTVDSMSFRAVSFYGGFERYMTGFEEDFEVHRIQRYYPGARFTTHRPPTINAPDGKPWREHRHMNHHKTDEIGLRFYHYSYVFPTQMEAKALYYAEMGGNIPDYFERVYLPWVLGDSYERYAIEERYNGVHNWLPSRRGSCRTREFVGEHPAEIQRVMGELKRRLKLELGE
jgi:hypothetical protein